MSVKFEWNPNSYTGDSATILRIIHHEFSGGLSKIVSTFSTIDYRCMQTEWTRTTIRTDTRSFSWTTESINNTYQQQIVNNDMMMTMFRSHTRTHNAIWFYFKTNCFNILTQVSFSSRLIRKRWQIWIATPNSLRISFRRGYFCLINISFYWSWWVCECRKLFVVRISIRVCLNSKKRILLLSDQAVKWKPIFSIIKQPSKVSNKSYCHIIFQVKKFQLVCCFRNSLQVLQWIFSVYIRKRYVKVIWINVLASHNRFILLSVNNRWVFVSNWSR